MKKIIIIAGPNGAGKTTFARDFLPAEAQTLRFINANLIAAGLAYLKKIAMWQAHGYQVKLWFLSLPNEDIAVSRVARRVLQGGHNIPEDVIRRRFKAGLANFHERYSKAVDSWALFDSYHRPPKLIDWSNK